MAEYPYLPNAPIVEALIDIQVQLSPSKTIDDIKSIFEEVKEAFPKMKERRKFHGLLEFQGGRTKADIQNNEIDGFIFLSDNEEKIIQSRLDGFSYHYKNKYSGWDDFSSEAQKIWELYNKKMEPVGVKRLGLRYINKIYLKTPFDPLNYFKTLPTLSDQLEYDIFRLFSQMTISNNKIEAFGILTQATEDADADGMNFIFDIDVFKGNDFKLDEIWDGFNQLRDFKNEIFFKSITENTLKLLS